MTKEIKAVVSKEDTFDKLEIRVGKVASVSLEPAAPKKAYKITVDFGKFGHRTTVGRFTHHTPDEISGQVVVGVLNFGLRMIGGVESEFLLLGAQYPKAESGEATFLTLAADSKIGGKIF